MIGFPFSFHSVEMDKFVLAFILFWLQRSVYSGNGSTTLLFANQVGIYLIPSENANNSQTIINDLQQAMACDYIYSDHHIYWIDSIDYGKGKIQYTDVRDPHHEKTNVITSGLIQPNGLACDWIGKKLYWTDAETNRIEVSELNGTSRKVLVWDKLDEPRAIAVDPHNAYMYWTDWGEHPKIERAGMDGTKREVLVSKNVYWPNGLTLDYDEGKIYWVEANYHFIHRMNFDGTNREEVITSEAVQDGFRPLDTPSSSPATTSLPMTPSGGSKYESKEGLRLPGALQHPYAITLYKEYIYWTDLATYSVHQLYKNGSGLPDLLLNAEDFAPKDIQVYEAGRQKPGRNPCGNSNGGCSHLCLLSPDQPGYRCACPTGVVMKFDNRTCNNGPTEMLLLARRADIRMVSLDTEDHCDVIIPVNNIKYAVAIEYEARDEYVYWTDDERHTILRAHLNGSGSETVVSESVEQSDGIAIDWIARNLYWTDTGRDYISVSRLNGTSRKVLIETGIDEPRAIVLDPVAGHMYWSDWGYEAKIERANLDGSDRLPFVDTDVYWPNGLAIDYQRSLLFWAEAREDRIEVIFLNGTGRKIIVSEELPHIFGLSVLGDYLYWTDWQRRRIERIKFGRQIFREVVIDQLPDIYGVKATSKSVLSGTNACAVNNGGCSHLCLYTPKGRKCHCPTGLELSSNSQQCVVPEAFLLFSFTKMGGISRMSLDLPYQASPIPFQEKVDASFLDFSIADKRIYWTNTKDMIIMRSFMNGTKVERFIDVGIEMLEGLAVDWIGRNVYWADSSTNRIEVAHMDRSSRRSIVWKDIESPRCLALDPTNGYIYWSEWGSIPCIKRAEMDGSNAVRINKETIGRANSLTIDHQSQRLYWVDFDINQILSSDMNGYDVIEIINGSSVKTTSSLTLFGEYIYWSDSKRRSIERTNKISGYDEDTVISQLNDIDDIMVYHTSRQSGVTSCARNNRGCEHFCLSLPEGRQTCACPAHYTLNSNNITCAAPTNFLLLSQTHYITRIIFQLPGSKEAVVPGIGGKRARKQRPRPSPDAVLPVRGIQDACAVDYDPLQRTLYWLDCQLGEIRSLRANDSEIRTILANNKSSNQPFDIAVDPYGRMLYWTDSFTNSIQAMRLDGTSIGTVLSGVARDPGGRKLAELLPRKIVVDPVRGRLYFSNACKNINSCRIKILRSAVDGSECIVFFNRGLRNVSALAVDSITERLYWANEKTIEFTNLDGSGHKVMIASGLHEPVGLAIFGQDLYWVDAQADGGLIEGANKIDGSNRRKIQGRMRYLRDIVSVADMSEDMLKNHPCSLDNGGCSHLCVTKDDGSTRCSCPKHLTLVRTFTCEEPSTCNAKEFTCKRVHQCVPLTWRCDGRNDCSDETDERDCPVSKPCQGRFSCGSLQSSSSRDKELLRTLLDAQCIEHTNVCDGTEHCINGQDEEECSPCQSANIKCRNGQCVSPPSLCDDCPGYCKSSVVEDGQGNPVVITVGIVCGCALLLGLGLLLRHCRTRSNYPPGVVTFTSNSNGQLNVNVEIPPNNSVNPSRTALSAVRKKPHCINFSIFPPGSANGSASQIASSRIGWPVCEDGQLAERPHVPGESNKSSVKRHPPNGYQTPNNTCTGEYCCSSDTASQRTAPYYRCRDCHKHRRRFKPSDHGPPPPTPCTTDTCEDFDALTGRSFHPSNSGSVPHEPPPPYYHHHSCCYHCYHQHHHYHTSSSASTSSRRSCGEPPSYERQKNGRRRYYNRQMSGLNSDSDPYAPPPTPRSQYMSECCDTTEVEDIPEEDEAIICQLDDDAKIDDEETILLAPSQRSSPAVTERSFSTLLCNPPPPPSPVTDSS